MNKVCRKLSFCLLTLKKASTFCDLSVMKSLYFAFIHSHISFGIILYESTLKENLNRILLLQKRFLRIMLKLRWDNSVREKSAEFVL